MKQISSPSEGMRDLLPKQVALRNHVLEEILKIYTKFGFVQIKTPSVERIELLSKSDGGDNEQMIFKILKRGQKLNLETAESEADIVSSGLRYDLTVPLSRFYANNKGKELGDSVKIIQTGDVWRAEKPQKGRYRQFTQCDIDIIGNGSILSEIELITATYEALLNLLETGIKVKINDRRLLESIAKHCGFAESEYGKVFIILDKLDKIGLEKVTTELNDGGLTESAIVTFVEIINKFRNGELTLENISNVIPDAPQEIVSGLSQVIAVVSSQFEGKSIEFDLSLVRGMGYYTGQIFEVELKGYKSSIAGGGRYDKMIGKYLKGDQQVPACGFSIGFERLISILEERAFSIPETQVKKVILYNKGESNFLELLSKAQNQRKQGAIVFLAEKRKNLTKQLDDFKKEGYSSFAVFGSEQALSFKELG